MPEKITPQHRERHAYVYVRQSTPQQVQHHRESQRNQYALVERVTALGWPGVFVHVIDRDLGQSGRDSNRPGFQDLVAEVSLGRVGVILAYEASRLARNNADWYTLLDLAAVVGTLIADTDGVYDPQSYNDRLLLGLRGMPSGAELHLRLRMDAGRVRQIERGTYRQHLPTLWTNGTLSAVQQKALLRSLIRRIIVTRLVPGTVKAKVVWASGAITGLAVHPPILRGSAVSNYENLVERVLALGAEGHQDREIARRLTAEGFRSARSSGVRPSLVGKIRRAQGQSSLTEQFRTQTKVEGQWTIWGLAQELDVHRNWLYARIRNGTIPASRHAVIGSYLIPDDAHLLALLRAQRERCCYR